MNTKMKVICVSAGLFSIASAVAVYTLPLATASAENVNFTVNVAETLAVSLTKNIDDAASSGTTDTFLRNTVLLSVFSNASDGSAAGYTATMYEDGSSTNLVHENNAYLKTINGNTDVVVPTLTSSSIRSSFPAGRWGYSLEGTVSGVDAVTYGETLAGSNSSTYYAMVNSSSPVTVLKSATAGSGERNIFFGAKPSASNPSGTYSGTVVINVVTGTINENTNPTIPTNPAVDQPTTPSNPISYDYYSTPNRTVYTSVSSTPASGSDPASETTTTIISSGDTRSTYAAPAGETERTMASVSAGSPMALGLAVAAGVAATSGILFFVLAKRKDGDDEEDEES